MKNARNHIAKLSSPEFYGRGYTHGGLLLTENYLASAFETVGLLPVYAGFRQKVEFPVNIIHSSEFIINDRVKDFGTEYLIFPGAESKNIKSKVFLISNEVLNPGVEDQKEIFKILALNQGKIPVLDLRTTDAEIKSKLNNLAGYLDQEKTLYDFPALIEIHNKLTHGVSSEQDNFMTIFTTLNIKGDETVALNSVTDLKKNFVSHNIVGKITGFKSDSAVIITAHFDHLGTVNQTVFPGANDNASGVSMLLNLAGYFKKHPPAHDIYFYALTGEEAGLHGAVEAVKELPVPVDKIKFVINLDMLGTGEDGIQIVNSTIFTEKFDLINQINIEQNLVNQIKKRGEACNSDHCAFHIAGIPSFFIYTLGGVSHYHDTKDTAKTLPLTDYYDIYTLLTQFIEEL